MNKICFFNTESSEGFINIIQINYDNKGRKDIIMKKQVRIISILTVMGICFGLSGITGNMQYAKALEDPAQIQLSGEAKAESNADISELSQLMTAEESVDMKAAPEDSAEVIMSYQKGDSVFVTGETADGWYRAIYQNKEGYIPKRYLSVQEIDVAALDEEMAMTEQEAQLVVETVERYRADARRSKIWGSVIIVLVLGIFATGIISGIKSAKGKEEQEA